MFCLHECQFYFAIRFRVAFAQDVPGQTGMDVPLSFCPNTRARAKIPGQTPLSRNKMNFYLSTCTRINSEKMTRLECWFPVQEHSFLFKNIISCVRTSFSFLECPFLLCPVLSLGKGRDRLSKLNVIGYLTVTFSFLW